MELEDSAGFENSAGKPHIRWKGGIPGGMIRHHDEGIGGEYNRRLKHFTRMR